MGHRTSDYSDVTGTTRSHKTDYSGTTITTTTTKKIPKPFPSKGKHSKKSGWSAVGYEWGRRLALYSTGMPSGATHVEHVRTKQYPRNKKPSSSKEEIRWVANGGFDYDSDSGSSASNSHASSRRRRSSRKSYSHDFEPHYQPHFVSNSNSTARQQYYDDPRMPQPYNRPYSPPPAPPRSVRPRFTQAGRQATENSAYGQHAAPQFV